LQETPVLQLFLQFSPSMRNTQSTTSRLTDAARKGVARTLSRDFWQ
jgi:hypothetical protein